MKKTTVLLTALSLLAMACTCPLTSIFQGAADAQAGMEEAAGDLSIALTEAAGDLSMALTETAGLVEESITTEIAAEPTETIAAPEVPTESADDVPGIGASFVREKDGMEMMYIPAGSFLMGSESGEADERPVHEVTLDAFWMDKYEVTNAQYQQCVADNFCVSLPASLDSYARENYYENPEFANFPVIYVDYYQAFDYCLWAGDRNGVSLPTEAQWEKAAKGTDERVYPWGNQTPDCSLENEAGCNEDTVAVGSFPQGASPYGVLDMAGNVWEWTQDFYGENYYGVSPTDNPEGPEEYSDMRVIRGGSFGELDDNQRTTRRYPAWEGSVWFSLGFRCVIAADRVGQ